MRALNIEQTTDMVLAVCRRIIESKRLLTEVDSKIGDGDHGIGMSIGMESAKAALLKNAPFADINAILKTTGMAMLNSMGGASGAIFGSMFFGGIRGMESFTELDGQRFVDIMANALKAIKQRGQAQVGDKTMVDAFEPAVLAMDRFDKSDLTLLLDAGSEAAEQGVENSKKYIAKFGKAQYLGERAVGLQDAGATSVAIILRAMHRYLEELDAQQRV